MTARRLKTKPRSTDHVLRFAVLCVRADKREKIFMRYGSRGEAELVAKHLTAIGCPSRVSCDDDGEATR